MIDIYLTLLNIIILTWGKAIRYCIFGNDRMFLPRHRVNTAALDCEVSENLINS